MSFGSLSPGQVEGSTRAQPARAGRAFPVTFALPLARAFTWAQSRGQVRPRVVVLECAGTSATPLNRHPATPGDQPVLKGSAGRGEI